MRLRFYISFVLVLMVLISLIAFSCTYKKFGEDQDLYLIAKTTTDFVWYKNSKTKLPKTTGSGHSQPLLSTRFNAIAAANLDANFKVKTGSGFAEESLIVKELYDSDGKLDLYAILYKKATHANADSRGWVWGYINADGSVRIGSSKKGKDCTSCHSQSGNEDYTLMNKFFP